MTGRQNNGVEFAEIDPVTHPILARHWPFVPPNWKLVGQTTAEIVDRLALQRAVLDDDHEAAA